MLLSIQHIDFWSVGSSIWECFELGAFETTISCQKTTSLGRPMEPPMLKHISKMSVLRAITTLREHVDVQPDISSFWHIILTMLPNTA
jgi:hypothetical protein